MNKEFALNTARVPERDESWAREKGRELAVYQNLHSSLVNVIEFKKQKHATGGEIQELDEQLAKVRGIIKGIEKLILDGDLQIPLEYGESKLGGGSQTEHGHRVMPHADLSQRELVRDPKGNYAGKYGARNDYLNIA